MPTFKQINDKYNEIEANEKVDLSKLENKTYLFLNHVTEIFCVPKRRYYYVTYKEKPDVFRWLGLIPIYYGGKPIDDEHHYFHELDAEWLTAEEAIKGSSNTTYVGEDKQLYYQDQPRKIRSL